jgi:FlaG/FlaF family flagellin (archaellin)
MAKVTVSFVTADDESKMTIESDPDRNKDYTGRTKTKFRYGDTAYFRVYSHEPENISASASDCELTDMGYYSRRSASIHHGTDGRHRKAR